MKVRVFRFRYFDRLANGFQLSDDYATERAIDEMGGEPVYALPLWVELTEISPAGLLKRAGADSSDD